MRSALTRSLVLAALFAALTAVCSQIQIPLPYVPINLALFAVHLAGALLGPKWGALSMAAYALLGAVGVPVFAGFKSGPAALFGKTGGYILGYILCALVVGLITRKFGSNLRSLCLSMVAGVAVCYAFGTIWFMALTGMNLVTSLSYCVIPFLPGDAVKILLAAVLSLRLQKPMRSMGLLPEA
ncbi:MAG: biotin transporter BioY [Clostridia bacterium]|nr:biotin transporter BioY [Clostridia bacterium]